MKTADIKKSIKNKTIDELKTFIRESKESLRQNRFSSAGSKKRDVKRARMDKKSVARALTALRSRHDNS